MSNYAKLFQISKIKIFLQKHVNLVQFRLRIPKMLFILRTALRNAKNCISKKRRHHFYQVFNHCTATNKDIALKIDVCCLYVALQHVIRFQITSKFWILYAFM